MWKVNPLDTVDKWTTFERDTVARRVDLSSTFDGSGPQRKLKHDFIPDRPLATKPKVTLRRGRCVQRAPVERADCAVGPHRQAQRHFYRTTWSGFHAYVDGTVEGIAGRHREPEHAGTGLRDADAPRNVLM
jgi:hypothetical protein